MAHWVLKDWDGRDACFTIPGPIAGDDIKQRLGEKFPADAAVTITRAAGEPETVRFGQLSEIALAHGDALILPGIPVAAGPLLYVMDRLLGRDGCPWDKQQTPHSLLRYLLDESYEAAEALVADDMDAFIEELGDVLLQVAFQGALVSDTSFDDIAERQAKKLVRRHPHVFAQESWSSADEVRQQWDALKAEEPSHQKSATWVFPALVAAKRLSKVGLRPESEVYQAVLDLLKVYLDNNPGKIEEILADAAWAIAQFGSIHHMDAEWALWKKAAQTAEQHGPSREFGGKKRISRSLGE
ncbi:MAG: nucleotide pyrophosphohydrolase [Sulfobacillus acidophilus]|uniref:Nucleotide pyrophosphohydrolase n=1 Tax=Sulfobacillus acidophilus TaxID=53633 RepID=A0A2T2WH54_9FIRM|nr:MAG: nucleotide pyrophosphohydrolase [Sulfobacillus acidophilus]